MMDVKKVIVTGGRGYADRELVYDVLNTLNPLVVVHGDARGADRLAKDWAEDNFVKQVPYPYIACAGKAGGPRRNEKMVNENLDADMLISFPGGRGTAHCTEYARSKGLKILEIDDNNWTTTKF